jgi:hypothetical protein
MLTPIQYDFCDRFYALGEAVEAVISQNGYERHFRIETLRDDQDRYLARVLTREQYTLQPTHTQSAVGHVQKPKEVSLWVEFAHFPETGGTSAEEAIASALEWLRQGFGKPKL